MNRRVLLNLAVFSVLFLIMVGWAIRNVVSIDLIEDPYPLSAEFANAFGVGANAEVTYRGVPYGSVTGVTRTPGGALVRMRIARDKHIPAGSTAHILRKSVIGEPYVDFEPPAGDGTGRGPYLEAGDRVPRERTTIPLEFSEMLRSASALVSSIPPEDVRTLVHELATGLQGRTESLRQLASSGERLAASLAAKDEALDRLLANQTRVTDVVAEHRGDLGQSLTDLRQLAESLRNAQGDTTVLLERGRDLLGQTAGLVAARKADLDCDLKVLEQVVDLTTTPRRLAGLQALLDMGPRALGYVWEASDVEPDGRWIRVGLITNPEHNPPPQHQPGKPLPEVRPVPACVSSLQVSGVTYQIDRNRDEGPLTGVLPATGGQQAAGGALLLGGFVAVRRLRLRSRP